MTTRRQQEIRRKLQSHMLVSQNRESETSWLSLALALGLVGLIASTVLFVATRTGTFASSPGAPSISFDGIVEGFVDTFGGSAFDDVPAAAGTSPTPRATPAPTAEPTPTPQPTIDVAAVSGSPYAASSAISAWESAGLSVDQRPLDHPGLASLGGQALGLTLQSGAGAVDVVLIVYPDSSAVSGDWVTRSGQKPRPKGGVELPSYETVWWNRNVIALITERDGSSSTAFQAFFDIR